MATQDIYKMGTINVGGTPTTNSVPSQATTSNVPTAEQNLAAYNASKNIGNQTITSNGLKTPTTVPLDTQMPKTDYSSVISNTLADLTTQQNNYQAQVDAYNKQGKETASSVADLQSLLGGRGADTTKIYQEQGVNKVYNQIADIAAQATGLKNEAQAIPIQIQNESVGQGVTDAGIAPIQSARLRDNALKALSLGQQAAIATAQYDKAKNYADQLITAKYDQIEADINSKLANLQALKDFDLTPTQKKLADATSQRLRYEEMQAQNNKKKEEDINNLLFNAYQQEAPKSIVAKAETAAKTGDVRQVASILGQYAGDYWKLDSLKQAGIQSQINNGDYVGAASNSSATAQDIAKAISGQETNYGKDVRAGASGELASKYQYMPATWRKYSQEYNNSVNKTNAPLAFDRNVEDAVTEWKVQQWLNQGFTPVQIAAMWNGGEGAANDWQNRVGVNKQGVRYSVPDYVKGFSQKLLGTTQDIGTLNLDKTQKSEYDTIIKEVNGQTKDDMETIKFANSIKGTGEQAKSGNRQAQIAVIFNFMKALDPNSTVRESEFSLIQNAQSLPQSFQQAVIKWGTGERLDSQMVDEMIAVATDRAASAKRNVDSALKDAESRAAQFKIPAGSITKLYQNRLNSSAGNLEDEAIASYEKISNNNELNYSAFESMVKMK